MASSTRYQQLDSDEYRLPDGMQRVGYDADEQRYTYRDTDGTLWEGEEGETYGTLHRVGQRPPPNPAKTALLKAHDRAAWRYMLPFFVLVGLFLVFVFRITHSSRSGDDSGGPGAGDRTGGIWPNPRCAEGHDVYAIVRGDTCWDIAKNWGITVDELRDANQDLKCEALEVGRKICVSVKPLE